MRFAYLNWNGGMLEHYKNLGGDNVIICHKRERAKQFHCNM